MKNKIILALSAIIFLSSCASKFSLTKRKYTKGYYFAASANKNSGKNESDHKAMVVKNLPAKKTALPANKNEEVVIAYSEPVAFFKPQAASVAKQAAAQKQGTQKVIASAAKKQSVAFTPIIKPVKEKQNKLNTSKKASDSDVNLVLMIILCLFPFINLIPVYIHDGKKLTLNFLITLLLDFTWILGVVYALLVVLDVVDLA